MGGSGNRWLEIPRDFRLLVPGQCDSDRDS